MYNNIQKILAFYLEAPRSSSRRTFVSFLNRLESNNVGCTGIVMLKGGCRCCCCEPATRSNSHSCSLILQHPKCTVHFLFGRGWGFHFSFEAREWRIEFLTKHWINSIFIRLRTMPFWSRAILIYWTSFYWPNFLIFSTRLVM